MESQTLVFTVLSYAALSLLVVVTLGIVYLTLADWRDRRRLDQERHDERIKRG